MKIKKLLASLLSLVAIATLSSCGEDNGLYDYESFIELCFVDQYRNYDTSYFVMQADYLEHFETDEELFKFLFPDRTTRYFSCFELYHSNKRFTVNNYKELYENKNVGGGEHVKLLFAEDYYYPQNGKCLKRIGVRYDVRIVYNYNTFDY